MSQNTMDWILEQAKVKENRDFVLKRVYLASVIYLIGYWNFSIVWLAIAIGLWVAYDKLYVHKCILEASPLPSILPTEEEIITKQFNAELPAWVQFPDVQRCDWLNQIIEKFWPRVTAHFSKSLEENLNKCILHQLGFVMKSFRLGLRAPKINGIKIYNHHCRRDQLLFDVDFAYLGDCHGTIDAVLMNVDVTNFQMRGRMRFDIKPLLHRPPFMGTLEVCFVEMPDVEFEMVTGKIPILDVFNLSSQAKKIFKDLILSGMVMPKKVKIPLTEDHHTETAHSTHYSNCSEDEICLEDVLKSFIDLDLARRMHRL